MDKSDTPLDSTNGMCLAEGGGRWSPPDALFHFQCPGVRGTEGSFVP